MTNRIRVAPLLACLVLASCGEVVKATDGGAEDAGVGADARVGPDAMVDAMVDPCTVDPSLAEAQDCMLDTVCSVLERCVSLNPSVCRTLDVFLFDDLPLRVSSTLLPEAVAAGHLSYSGTALAACLVDLANLSCNDLFSSNSPFDSCSGFTGLVSNGGVCHHEIECASAGYCEGWDRNVQCSTGLCRPPKPNGSACAANNECASGSRCVGSPQTCRSGAAGQPCNSDFECDGSLFCSASVCTPKRGLNQACTDDGQCSEPLECIGDDLPAGAGTCQSSTKLGDPCDTSFGCFAFFSGLYCDQPDPNAAGVCRAAPVAGENCDSAPVCQDFALCTDPQGDGTNECVARGLLGQPCSDDTCQQNLFCTSEVGELPGTCSGPRAMGNCTNDDHCASGYCDNASGVCRLAMACH